MVQRGQSALVMGGAWVFPGGIVDPTDWGDLAKSVVAGVTPQQDLRWIAAALRELVEEVRIWITTVPFESAPDKWLRDAEVFETARDFGAELDAQRVAYFANWITPTMIPARFDTRFFAIHDTSESEPQPDPRELAAAEWIEPREAISRAKRAEWVVPLPTMRTLELLASFETADGLMKYAHGLAEIVPMQSRRRVDAWGNVELVLPGDPGYENLADADPDALTKAAHIDSAARGVAEFSRDES